MKMLRSAWAPRPGVILSTGLFLLAGLFLLPQVGCGQTVLGKVIDAVTQDGVGEAEIVLRTPGGEVDGMKVREGGFVLSIPFDDLVAPQEVEAIEVYAGGATLPRQWLSDSGCGLVVIWTKR